MDIGTLFAAQSVMLVGYTVVLVTVARSQPDLKGIRWFAGSSVAMLAGTLLGQWLGGPFDAWVVTNLAVGHAPLHGAALDSFLIVLDDLLMLLPLVCVRNGLAEFVGEDSQRRTTDLPIVLTTGVGLAWFTVAHPNPVGRDAIYSLAAGLEASLGCYLLVRYRPAGGRHAATLMTGIMGICGLTANIRVVSILLLGAPLLHFLPDGAPGVTILVRMIFCFVVSFCFLWMVTEQLRSSLEQLAHTDYLTGTLNRRFLRACAERELALSQRSGQDLSVLVIDIDHFKLVNDTYGHSTGDESLRRVAAALREVLRQADLLARYGGEEFVIVLPATNGESALLLAERLRAKIEALCFGSEWMRIRLTASFGVAQYRTGAESWDTLLGRADHALYAAKQAGRNRTVLAVAQ